MSETETTQSTQSRISFGSSILIADDDEVVRLYLECLLHEQGYEVTAVADFQTVKEVMQKHRYALVLMDIVFLDQPYSGFDIVQYIRSVDAECAVLIMTSYPSTHSAVEALRLNASDYLAKPVRQSELLSSVSRIFDESSLDKLAHSIKHLSGHTLVLSKREREVLLMLYKGCSYSEIADSLHCSLYTAKTHGKRIYKKMGVHSRSEAVHEALSMGVLRR